MSIDEYFLITDPPQRASLKKKWITTILTAIQGGEQRFALLTWPRRSLAYDFVPLTRSDLNYINRILFKNLHNTLGFPFFQDKTLLTSQASSGQKILHVESTLYRNFEIGAPCMLLASRSSYEVGSIAALSTNQITLEDNLSHTWPVGTMIYPVLIGKVNSIEEIQISNSRYGGISILANEDYDDAITRHTPNISMFQIYKDFPVFHFRPKLGSLKQGLSHPYDYLAFFGKSYSESTYLETSIPLEGNFLAREKQTI